MKHFSIQKTNGWCAVHTLANVLRDNDFFKYLDNPKYKNSTYITDNEMLKELGFDFFINPLVNMPQNWKGISKGFVCEILTDKNCFDYTKFNNDVRYNMFVFFLTVKVKEEHDEFHSVAVLRYGDRFIFSDPNMSEYVELPSVWDLFDYFEYCNGIETLGIMVDNVPHFAALIGEYHGFDEILDKERPVDYKACVAN
jgi:hypothetical protein